MIKIAIVDDNSFLITATQEKLSFFEDFLLKFIAINGLDLNEKLEKSHNTDLILMGIEMPKMHGIEPTSFCEKQISANKNYYACHF